MKIKHLEHLENSAYFGDGKMPCVVREMKAAPSNTFVALHDHGFSELVVVASGSLQHIHTKGIERTSAGDFFVIHPGERHGFAELAEGTSVFNIIFDNTAIPQAMSLAGCPLTPLLFPHGGATVRAKPLGHVPRRNLDGVVGMIRAMRSEGASRRPFRQAVCASLFAAVALTLSRHMRHPHGDPAESLKGELDFIAENYMRKITLDDLRAISGRSMRALYKEFDRLCGKSPAEYIISLRVAKAKALLSRNKLTMDEIAMQTGFCDASHLSRTLRAYPAAAISFHLGS